MPRKPYDKFFRSKVVLRQAFVIDYITEHPGHTIRELAELWGVNVAQATHRLYKLRHKTGLIEPRTASPFTKHNPKRWFRSENT